MPGIDYVATSQAFPLPIGATRFFLTAPVTPSRQFVPYWLRMERDGGRLRQMIGQASLGIPDLINTIYCVNVEMHSVSALVNQEIGSGSISFYCPGKVQNTLETVLESAPARYLEKEGSFAREWKARAPPLVRSRDPQNERQPFFFPVSSIFPQPSVSLYQAFSRRPAFFIDIPHVAYFTTQINHYDIRDWSVVDIPLLHPKKRRIRDFDSGISIRLRSSPLPSLPNPPTTRKSTWQSFGKHNTSPYPLAR